jgi:hypothetical protein
MPLRTQSFTNLLSQATNLQKDQNKNEELQPKEVIPLKAGESSEPLAAGIVSSASAEVKEETSATQPQTTIPIANAIAIGTKLQTNSMEVHKHPHHLMHSKKWTEYLLEFLMIFLAVTLGFFAENLREHFAEHKMEKQYARSLYDDLSRDTAAVTEAINQKTWIVTKLDSLQQLLALPDFSSQSDEVYYLERFLTKNEMFNAQDVTYQQLKSSGNFRFIGNQNLYKKVADYYGLYTRYQTLIESQFENMNNLTEMESSLFNGNDLSSLNDGNAKNFYSLFKRPQNNLHPITKDEKALNFLRVKVGNAIMLQKTNIVFLKRIKQNATDLLTELDKEY